MAFIIYRQHKHLICRGNPLPNNTELGLVASPSTIGDGGNISKPIQTNFCTFEDTMSYDLVCYVLVHIRQQVCDSVHALTGDTDLRVKLLQDLENATPERQVNRTRCF